jgi:FG-GAP repeat
MSGRSVSGPGRSRTLRRRVQGRRSSGCHVLGAILPALVVAALTVGTTGPGQSAASHLGHDLSATPAPGSNMSWAQAPAALRGAVRRSLASSVTRQQLPRPPGSFPFGYSVAVSGNTALVGAPESAGSGGAESNDGAVYAYTESGGTWTEQAELTIPADDPAGSFGYEFGCSVVCSAIWDGGARRLTLRWRR